MTNDKTGGNQYIYIVQATLDKITCKMGKTSDLERRLKEYNSMAGKSKNNDYQYLFACEVKNMAQVETDLKIQFGNVRENPSREIYFYNDHWFEQYVKFLKSHSLFVKEIIVKPEDKIQIVKIVKKHTPTLQDRGLTRENIITKAKKADNDEFYTRYEDIEKEVAMYPKNVWKNKVVFCNCDDAVGDSDKNTSAFALYFLKNFSALGLKKLICTHYSGKIDLFNAGAGGYIYTNDGIHIEKVFPKGYNGSFDDPLSLKILQEEADIVCTNPPFSRAIDYWDITIRSKKKFLIISNIINVLNTAYLQYFKDKQVWPGHNRIDVYLNPKRQPVEAAGHWYTNLKIKDRPKYEQLKIMALKKIPEQYKKYDDSKMLMVDNGYIPNDYKKIFGVSSRPLLNGLLEKGYELVNDKQYIPYIHGKPTWSRAIVRKT